jgi:PAS domain S-box-containing protein
MKYTVTDMIPVSTVHELTTSFYAATGIPNAIIDLSGTVITASGWQEICTRFHRQHPEAKAACIDSDVAVTERIQRGGEPYAIYECPHGLTDAAAPIIVAGKHLANCFTGQFFTRKPTADDLARFRDQARRYGFDPEDYLTAVAQVPVIEMSRLSSILSYLSRFAELLAETGLARLNALRSRDELEQRVAERTAELNRLNGALRNQEERYRRLVERSPDIIYSFSPKTGGSYVSQRVTEILGYSVEQLQADPFLWYRSIHPDDKPAVDRSIREHADDLDFEIEYRIQDAGGRWHWFHDRSIGRGEQDGARVIEGLAMDITDRKETEEALRESETRFRMITDSLPVLIAELDRNLRYVFLNRRYEELFGKDSDTCIGLHVRELLGEQGFEIVAPYLRRALAGEKVFYEYELPLSDGTAQTVYAHYLPRIDEDGEVKGIYVWAQDVTPTKQIEEHLRRAYEEISSAKETLEFENHQRRQTEDQLKVLLKETERANRELEDFAYVVSHDLKAPLRGISSLTNWIAEDYADQLDAEGREFLDDLKGQARLMHNLIDGILQYSRVGRGKVAPESVDADTLVRETIESLSPPESIEIRVDGILPLVTYDYTHLHQVFQNLIDNAIRHLGKPEGEIVISCRETRTAFEISVRDTGVGIPERHFERIFKMFQTLGTDAGSDSTGIGLALVKRIVERHGGTVRVESTEGEGSAFYFTVPRQAPGPIARDGIRVLLIDDNAEFSEVTTRMIQRAGGEVLWAAGGDTARGFLADSSREIDLILLDVYLPADDTLTLYESLRRLRPAARIIACTGMGGTDELIALEAAGVDGVIHKPFQYNELIELLGQSRPEESETS